MERATEHHRYVHYEGGRMVEPSPWLMLLGAFALGLFVMWMLSQRRKTVTELKRDANGYIVEIIEAVL